MMIEELLPGVNLETMNVEFKGIVEEGGDVELNWLKTIAAFANTQGGCLYIGVNDKTHAVLALEHSRADAIIQMVHRLIREKIDPRIDYEIDAIPVPSTNPLRYVIRVSVPLSSTLPVSVHSHGMLGIYQRRFGRTEIATAEQIRDMVLMSDNVSYDQPFVEQPYDARDFLMLHRAHEERTGSTYSDKELMSLGFMSRDRMLSRGALLFRDACADARTKIVATLWQGDTKGGDTVLASEEYTGDLLSSIEFARQFVENHSANGFKKTGSSRDDYIAYPSRSVTEGIVNAVGHRNYFIQGSQIEVNLFKDRLEITSPGSLLGVGRLEREHDIASIVPRRRNEVICDILASCRYMEEKGSGFDKIEQDYCGHGEGHRPFVSSAASSFTLTLPDLTYERGVIGDSPTLPDVHVDGVLSGKNDLEILSYCYRAERTARDIATQIGVTPSTYFRRETLGRLVEQGYLLASPGSKEPRAAARYTANPARVFV